MVCCSFPFAGSSLKDNEWKPLEEGYDFLKFIDEEEEEKERRRLKQMKLEEAVEDAILKEQQEHEQKNDEELNHQEFKPTNHHERPKTGRLRRVEVKDTVRDEL